MQRHLSTALRALSGLMLAGALGIALAGPVTDRNVSALLQSVAPFTSLPTLLPGTPAQPQQALIAAVNGTFADLGLSRDVASEVRAARLPDAVAGRLALAVGAVRGCAALTRQGVAALDVNALQATLAGAPAALDLSPLAGVADCARAAWSSVAGLEQTLGALLTQPAARAQFDCAKGFKGLDLWPVLRVGGTCADTYVHDYMVQVDFGGHDVYDNNAGSNMIDIRNGPVAFLPAGTSPVAWFERVGPAIGCETALTGLLAGDCVPLAALLLDLDGDDQYGVFRAPKPALDGLCTADPVVHRMVTGGVGFAGVGILRDRRGNDKYFGKTGTQGAGHIGGVGILSDGAGNDTYLAARNAQGFGLVGVLGLLHDAQGNDSYGFYLPRPLNPNAANQTPGSGGVIDDEGVCDNVPRFVQGGANLVGLGVLLDSAGHDRYQGAEGVPFIAPFGASGVGGSQGFAINGGTGALIDLGGTDTYTGATGRANGKLLLPGGTATNTGLFADL